MVNRFLLLSVFGLSFPSYSSAQEFSPRYELVRKSSEVNTKLYDEVAPVISTDGKKLYFFVYNHPENTYGKDGSQDIWFTNLDDKGVWSKAKRLGPPLNQNRYNQVFNVLPDGSLFIRGGHSKNSKGFSIVSPSGAVSELRIKDFDKLCKGLFYGATISADAKHAVLYFSEIPNSKFSDLYITNLQPDGNWSLPAKMAVSTPSDEFSPFIGPDQTTLFFASERMSLVRMGKADIYKISRLDDTWTNWSQPVNLGKGVNTSAIDSYFSIDALGNVFTCRMGSVVDGGNYDIFLLKPRDIKIMLSLTVLNAKTQQPISTPVELRIKDQKTLSLKTNAAGKVETRMPEIVEYSLSANVPTFLPKEENFKLPKVGNDTTFQVVLNLTPIEKKLFLAGDVIDKKTQQLINAKVDLVYKSNAQSKFVVTAEGGKYRQEVVSVGEYLLTASAEGYLNSTDSVTLVAGDENSGIKNLFLNPIEVGATIRLKNIYFDFDKTTLKPESFLELNKVFDFLKQNLHVEIEIEGHTDSKGADEYNLNLSQGRSQSVVDYIVSQGIDRSRLAARGYGESKPVDTNDTEEGRANNRRVEFTILKK